jgi:hypothetical protein
MDKERATEDRRAMTARKTREEAASQWERDADRTEETLGRPDQRSHNEWAQDVCDRIKAIGGRDPGRNYADLLQIYCSVRARSQEVLIPRLRNSPHTLSVPQTLDWREDMNEERWGEHSPCLPPHHSSQKLRPGPDDLTTTHREWKRRMADSAEWLENTMERQEAQEEAELRKMDLPAYIPDQLTQNFYAFSLPIAAKARAWGETLIRNHGAALAA